MRRSTMRAIVVAIERDANEQALELLARAELDAFTRGDTSAGDLGWARWRLAGGDRGGALSALRALADTRGRS